MSADHSPEIIRLFASLIALKTFLGYRFTNGAVATPPQLKKSILMLQLVEVNKNVKSISIEYKH